jgi:hypothetical protein
MEGLIFRAGYNVRMFRFVPRQIMQDIRYKYDYPLRPAIIKINQHFPVALSRYILIRERPAELRGQSF